MSVLAIILVASESSDSVMQPHEQDDVVPVLECVRRHCPVRFGGPREIANDPVVVFSMGEEVAAFGDFAECGATWQMVMECAFPLLGFTTTAARLENAQPLSGSVWTASC